MVADRMTIDTYLANYSEKRRIDGVIKQWFVSKNGPKHCVKTKKEWEKEIKAFFSETEIKNIKIK
jgi:hypothetical protein